MVTIAGAIAATNLTEFTGARIDCDLATLLAPESGPELRRLLVDRGMLLVPQANLTDEQQVTLASHLGRIRDEGEKGIFKITLDNRENAQALYLKGSMNWHMDGTHDTVPVFGSLLSGRVLSQEGGQTEFTNSYAAYEALPQAMKDRIQNLRVEHSFAVSMQRCGLERTPETAAHWDSIPLQQHALVWTHASGRKSLVIGCHASHVVGMDRAESDALLDELMDWVTQPRFVYRHEWTVGDLLIWDNTGVLHRAIPYPIGSGRMMHRTTLLGEEAFG